jgi:hypothetical protein
VVGNRKTPLQPAGNPAAADRPVFVDGSRLTF